MSFGIFTLKTIWNMSNKPRFTINRLRQQRQTIARLKDMLNSLREEKAMAERSNDNKGIVIGVYVDWIMELGDFDKEEFTRQATMRISDAFGEKLEEE